jgi:hypothetical protein
MNKFLDAYIQPKPNQEDINYLSRSITGNEIESVIKNLPIKKSPVLHGFIPNFTKPLKNK